MSLHSDRNLDHPINISPLILPETCISYNYFISYTFYNYFSLWSSNLNIPNSKSIYFPIVDFKNKTLLGPWQYKNGVFPGKFNRLIGSGGEGYVLEGEWKILIKFP